MKLFLMLCNLWISISLWTLPPPQVSPLDSASTVSLDLRQGFSHSHSHLTSSLYPRIWVFIKTHEGGGGPCPAHNGAHCVMCNPETDQWSIKIIPRHWGWPGPSRLYRRPVMAIFYQIMIMRKVLTFCKNWLGVKTYQRISMEVVV